MTFRIARFHELDASDLAAWSALQSVSPRHASVFFRPELAQVVHHVCGDVEVAVVQQHGTPVAYFPFQRKSDSAGWPLLACLSDVRGIVAAERIEWDPRALLAAAGLDVLYFDHLHDDGSPLPPADGCAGRQRQRYRLRPAAGVGLIQFPPVGMRRTFIRKVDVGEVDLMSLLIYIVVVDWHVRH